MQKQTCILVVDDDEEIGYMLEMVLQYNGFKVIVLERDEKIEETITANKVDVIILDMLIAGAKGTDICARLKSNFAFSALPVILATALPDAEQLSLNAGADDFLAKPFDMATLISKIKKHQPE